MVNLGLVTALTGMTFFLCLAIVPALRLVAVNTGLTDKPSGRKNHKGEVPLIGGLAIYISGAVAVALLFRTPLLLYFILISLPLIVIGVLDDLYDVHHSIRIVVQTLVSIAAILLTDIRIEQIGNIFGQGSVQLGSVVSPIFTVFCVIGVINAVNMLDGMNGLAGSITLVSVLALAGVSIEGGDATSMAIVAMLGGGIAAYLLYNLNAFGTKYTIFLGDAGSMFIGFSLVWLFIRLSQSGSHAALSPVAALWILGLPLLDMASVMMSRLARGVSLFTAGRDHMHHLLLDSEYSSAFTLFLFIEAQIVLMGVGLVVNSVNGLEAFSFWAFVALTFIIVGIRRKLASKV